MRPEGSQQRLPNPAPPSHPGEVVSFPPENALRNIRTI
jgi:hypothetical protein